MHRDVSRRFRLAGVVLVTTLALGVSVVTSPNRGRPDGRIAASRLSAHTFDAEARAELDARDELDARLRELAGAGTREGDGGGAAQGEGESGEPEQHGPELSLHADSKG